MNENQNFQKCKEWAMNDLQSQEMINKINDIKSSLGLNGLDKDSLKDIELLLENCMIKEYEGAKLADLGKKILTAHDTQGELIRLYGAEAMLTGRTAMKAGQIFAKLQKEDNEYNSAVHEWNKYLGMTCV